MTAQPARAAWELAAAALCLLLALAQAWHHPWQPMAAVAGTVVVALVVARWPAAWLTLLPAALPVASLAPWTGWIVFEEFDLLVLAAAAGGHAHAALHTTTAVPPLDRRERLAMAAVAGVTLAGLVRGLLDAGGLGTGMFQGQADPLNTWRVGKSMLFALLLYPLLRRQFQLDAQAAFTHLARGMVVGALLLCVLVLREREAFPGLLDWRLPYRTTAWFWDMHVGGAAIDAYLAITTPFVAWALWSARSGARWLAAALLAVAWTYACLTTYARGAYLGAAVSLFMLALRLPGEGGRGAGRAARGVLLAVGIVVPAWLAIDVAGTVAGLLVIATAGAALGLWRWRRAAGARPLRLRSLAGAVLALLLLFEAATVVGPDSYMWKRLNISGRDGVSRLTHWQHGLALLRTPADGVAGLGLGRLPTHFDRHWPREQFSGRAAWQPGGRDDGSLRLAGPRTLDRVGGLYGITQRVPIAAGYRVVLDLRVAVPVDLLVRICESHLLYDRVCQAGFLRIEPAVDPLALQQARFTLFGPPLGAGAAWAAREAVLNISVTNAGGVADIAHVALWDGNGRELPLRNPGFDQGLARWWPVAQFHFLPWHADNLVLELLIERGAVGLLLALALVVVAWRCARAERPAAWFAQAALAGGLCVGLVSSLMDVPRVAWLLGLMLMVPIAARDAGPPLQPRAP